MQTPPSFRALLTVPAALTGLLALTLVAPPAVATPKAPPKDPVAVGTGGAVSSVDPYATEIGLNVLRRGGNAVDAAVATAAALGVTEPYSAGIGGGGFFVYFDVRSGQVETIDGRETAPELMEEDAFVENGVPIPFAEAVTSGLSVGVPGTPATWELALDRWGSIDLRDALRPAAQLARRGFVVDETFHQQTEDNAARFADFTSTAELFLPDGTPPEPGSVLRNLDLARTYDLLGQRGTEYLYEGPLAGEIVDTVMQPPVVPGSTRIVRPGLMRLPDLAAYDALVKEPTMVEYRGLDVAGMGPPSSGGSTVGEALNILEGSDLGALDRTEALHRYLEASALAFADRNRYVGDDTPAAVLRELLSQGFADERACEITATAAVKPVPPGEPDGTYAPCEAALQAVGGDGEQGLSTTHLTTWDQWGNVVAYTLTIEQTGGSGIVVPDRGFLLNNELTDFNFTPTQGTAPDPNLPAPGKRPRSSMSPTIVLDGGEPVLALGSPGGSMIITTVLQTLVNRLDFGATLPEAVAAPRASQRNTVSVAAEPAFRTAWEAGLSARGHTFTTTAEIGAVTAIELLEDGTLLAAAEPVRRGGGDAGVVGPLR
ncbi:MAG TPA: gamma-glutamyltransferase [Jiangellaceae bacterium]|nr:gamma-glutamyltransferase [Jiangellaceae bacterium]